MIEAVVVLALAGAALAWVLQARPGVTGDVDPALERAHENKVATLSALVDLDEELEAGKIDATEHARLRARYEAEAVATLDELERLGLATTTSRDHSRGHSQEK